MSMGRDCFAQLPVRERDTLFWTILLAKDLAGAGRIDEGLHRLRDGLERARAAQHAGEHWGTDLVVCYSRALEDFSWRYGAQQFRAPGAGA